MGKVLYKKEFIASYETGDKLKVSLPRYDENIRFYTIGRTNLNESNGQVELLYSDKSMIVEYQWFNEDLTGRKIVKLN